ncbi:MAG: hypothetical protein H7144_13675 [Burkholderiales bacterium]|nr:hypothetical protein [Phycisphaerae bacterium]
MTSPLRLTDIIATVVIAMALLGTMVAARHSAQEANSIAGCALNLQRLGAALSQYQLRENGAFPRTRYEPDARVTAYTGAEAQNPFAIDGPAANDVTAAAFLLAREMEVPAGVFTCPAALRNGLGEVDTFDATTLRQRSNFAARVHYNYSVVNMYPSRAAIAAGYSLDRFAQNRPASFVIAGDTNPGGNDVATATTQTSRRQLRLSNSPNHQRNGQNFLFADGRVEYSSTPFVAGTYDNAYASGGLFFQPISADDAVLLPVWTDGPDVIPSALRLRRWVLVSASVATAAILGVIIIRGRRRSAVPRV